METQQDGGFIAGGTGLALTVGELREKVSRLKEELARTENDLRTADSRDKGELAGVDQRQQKAIESLTQSVAALTTRVAAREPKAPAKPVLPAFPARNGRERNQDYYQRVQARATSVGKPVPPKPSLGEQSADYGSRLKAWEQQNRI